MVDFKQRLEEFCPSGNGVQFRGAGKEPPRYAQMRMLYDLACDMQAHIESLEAAQRKKKSKPKNAAERYAEIHNIFGGDESRWAGKKLGAFEVSTRDLRVGDKVICPDGKSRAFIETDSRPIINCPKGHILIRCQHEYEFFHPADVVVIIERA